MDDAIPVGVIINELLTNAFEHAFPFQQVGDISISIQKTGKNKIELIVKDNGIGLSKEIDVHNTKTLGLPLVYDLTEGQLDGRLRVDVHDGTQFTIQFIPQVI